MCFQAICWVLGRTKWAKGRVAGRGPVGASPGAQVRNTWDRVLDAKPARLGGSCGGVGGRNALSHRELRKRVLCRGAGDASAVLLQILVKMCGCVLCRTKGARAMAKVQHLLPKACRRSGVYPRPILSSVELWWLNSKTVSMFVCLLTLLGCLHRCLVNLSHLEVNATSLTAPPPTRGVIQGRGVRIPAGRAH